MTLDPTSFSNNLLFKAWPVLNKGCKQETLCSFIGLPAIVRTTRRPRRAEHTNPTFQLYRFTVSPIYLCCYKLVGLPSKVMDWQIEGNKIFSTRNTK